MYDEFIEYFASTTALVLWTAMSCLGVAAIVVKITVFDAEFTFIKTFLSLTELAHFWIPIIWGKYLYRLAHSKKEDTAESQPENHRLIL
jgi:hypothetical protein